MTTLTQRDLFEDEIISTTDTSYIPESIRIKPTKEKQMKKAKQVEVSPAAQAITLKAIEQAQTILHAVKAQFVIVLPDGTRFEHGELQVKEPAKRLHKNPHGLFSGHYKPYLENLEVGGIAQIPVGSFVKNEFQSSLTAWMSANWGSKSYATQYDEKSNSIVVLRYK
jgi:hypothetical protein